MSTWLWTDTACPTCGATQRCEIARSISVSRSPKVRDDVVAGRLHRFDCSSCDTMFIVEAQFEYLDFDRKQLIVVFPIAEEARWVELEQIPRGLFERGLGDPGLPPFVRTMGEGFQVRAVFGLLALREKLMIADAGIDDVVVEMAKVAWMQADPRRVIRADALPRVVSRRGDELVLLARPQRDAPVELTLPIDVLRAGGRDEGELRERLSAGPYVDAGRLF